MHKLADCMLLGRERVWQEANETPDMDLAHQLHDKAVECDENRRRLLAAADEDDKVGLTIMGKAVIIVASAAVITLGLRVLILG